MVAVPRQKDPAADQQTHREHREERRRVRVRPMGKAERLKHSLFGLSSVRIDAANRLIYKIEGDALFIASCKGHFQ